MSTPRDLRLQAPRRAALSAVLLLLAAACSKAEGSATSAAAAGQVILRIGDQLGIARSGLEAAGELDGTPYAIEWASFSAGPPLLEAINADAIDIGSVGDTPPIFAQAAGAPIRIVAATKNRPEYEVILAPPGSKLRSFRELKGKKVALAKGSAAHHLLLAALRRDGLTMADITPVYLSPNEAQPAFTRGDVDAWAIWEPFVANNLRLGAVKITDGVGLMEALAFQVAGEKALADPAKAAAIGDYLVRAQRTQAWANEHKDVWARRYAEITKLPLEVAQDMFSRYEPRYIAIDGALKETQQKTADAFFDERLIPERLDVSKVFDERYNERLSVR